MPGFLAQNLMSASAPSSIDFDELSDYLATHAGELMPGATVQVEVNRPGKKGPRRSITGSITASLPSPFGILRLSSGWEANLQANTKQGWLIWPRPDTPGEGVTAPAPVMLDGKPCAPTGEQLAGLAWDFWSYQDIQDAVSPNLPNPEQLEPNASNSRTATPPGVKNNASRYDCFARTCATEKARIKAARCRPGAGRSLCR